MVRGMTSTLCEHLLAHVQAWCHSSSHLHTAGDRLTSAPGERTHSRVPRKFCGKTALNLGPRSSGTSRRSPRHALGGFGSATAEYGKCVLWQLCAWRRPRARRCHLTVPRRLLSTC